MGKTYKDCRDFDKVRKAEREKEKGGGKNRTKAIVDDYINELEDEWEDEQYLLDLDNL